MNYQSVVWKGDNVAEIERFLEKWVVRADPCGDQLRLVGLGGLNATIDLGDTILRDPANNQIGFVRNNVVVRFPQIVWTGDNVVDIDRFIRGWPLNVAVYGEGLFLTQQGQPPMVLARGDKIIKQGEALIVSRAGRDHRA